MWWAIAAAAVKTGLSMLGASTQRAITNINNNTDKTLKALENQNTQSNNILAAANDAAQRGLLSLNNQQSAKAAAAQLEAAAINGARQQKEAVSMRFEQSIGLSEQAGAQAAAIGASGAAGGVVDAVNSATALRAARAIQQTSEQQDQMAFDQARQMQTMAGQVASSQSVVSSTIALDYKQAVAQRQTSPDPFMVGLSQFLSSASMGLNSSGDDAKQATGETAGKGLKNEYQAALDASAAQNRAASNPYAVSLDYSIGKL